MIVDSEFGIPGDNCERELFIKIEDVRFFLTRKMKCKDPFKPGQFVLSESQYVYYADGQGEKNDDLFDKNIKSITKWDGRSVQIQEFDKDLPTSKLEKRRPVRTIGFRLDGDRLITKEKEPTRDPFHSIPFNTVIIKYKRMK